MWTNWINEKIGRLLLIIIIAQFLSFLFTVSLYWTVKFVVSKRRKARKEKDVRILVGVWKEDLLANFGMVLVTAMFLNLLQLSSNLSWVRQLNKVAARSDGTTVSAVKRIPNALSAAINHRNSRRSIIPYSQAGVVLNARLFNVPVVLRSTLPCRPLLLPSRKLERYVVPSIAAKLFQWFTIMTRDRMQNASSSGTAPNGDSQACIFKRTFSNKRCVIKKILFRDDNKFCPQK